MGDDEWGDGEPVCGARMPLFDKKANREQSTVNVV